MKSLSSPRPSKTPKSYKFVSAIFLMIFCSGSFNLMAQSSKPINDKEFLPRLELDTPEEENENDQIAYEVSPSTPLKRDIGPESDPTVHMASAEEVPVLKVEREAADMAFEIGKDTGIEGFRVAKIDKNGFALLLEDTIEPILYVRLQKVVTRHLEARVYAENGALLSSTKKRNLMCGTEFKINYSKWPKGVYTLDVRLDNGTRYVKKIIKSKNFNESF